MRRFLFLALLFLAIPISALGHPGRTDSQGGHMDHETNVYHYHHGYSAHFHPNGQCPYAFDDKTGRSSGPSGIWGNSGYEYPRVTASPSPRSESDGVEFSSGNISIGFVGGTALYGIFRAIARAKK